MALIGIGTDIIEIKRIDKLCRRFKQRFTKRVFTSAECESAKKQTNPAAFYAKRFAAKEAFSKALGCGIGTMAKWTDIEIQNTPAGQPVLKITGTALKTLSQKVSNPVVHVSLTDDKFAAAFVIIEDKC